MDERERRERMKPILDRIPVEWGKYLPGPGWDDILLELDAQLSAIDPDYVIYQAKEKFGELRFYSSLETNLDAQICLGEAYQDAAHACEACGEEGFIRRDLVWIKTLCDEHYATTTIQKRRR